MMAEYIFTTFFWGYKTKAFRIIKPFYCTCHNFFIIKLKSEDNNFNIKG
ncbi:MAG: DUF4783 domain-containing protein [Pedobacter sp.]|nr:MAG: DUF4783 domain-containing protein [Pedobacter sp.]